MWILRSAHKHIAQDTLSEYLDGRLRGRPLDRVEQRLEECDACRQDLAELQAMVAMMRQLPMEPPRRSFVMSAPPPEPVRAKPALALRAPNWVYAGAASVAALALAITVSVDATGGLSSGPLRRDAETTISVTAPAAEQPEAPAFESIPAPAGQAAAESAPASGSGEAAAPPSLAAAAPAAAAPAPGQEEQPTEGLTASGDAVSPMATPVPRDGQVQRPKSVAAPTPATAGQTSESLTSEAPAPIPERASPELVDEGSDGATSIWWRVLEVAAGALAVVFLAGLALRRRAGRRDSA